MRINKKVVIIFKLATSGGLIGLAMSFLLGATAVGVLGAGFGGPAGLIFAILGVIFIFAKNGKHAVSAKRAFSA